MPTSISPRVLLSGAAVLTATAATVATLSGGATAQSPTTRTVTIQTTEKGSTFTHIRNTKAGKKANSQGDLLAWTNPIVDLAGRVIGKESISCVTTAGNKSFMKSELLCTVEDRLPAGRIYSTGTVDFKDEVSFAVVGGTGEYAGARGTGLSTQGGAKTTITLVE